MLQINQIKVPVEKTYEKEQELRGIIQAAAKKLNVSAEQLQNVNIMKKSLDARKKPQLFYVYSISNLMSSR